MHVNIKNRFHNYFDDLIKPEKMETKNILFDEKNFKYLVICFPRYVNRKSIKMLSLYFYKLMGKTEENDGKNI